MKNNNFSKISKALVAFATVSILAGCVDEANYSTSSSSSVPVVEGKYIISNSHSEYSIVTSDEPSNKEKMAADTIYTYIKAATGAALPIITEKDLVFGTKYISLGNTGLFSENFADYDLSPLDGLVSSYFISTKNDNIYIYSNPNERGEGTLFGSFDLLHELIGYEYYAADEIYYEKTRNVGLRRYEDVFVNPSFDGRSIGIYYNTYHQEVNDNLRLINIYRGGEWCTPIFGHGQVTRFVKPEDTINGVTLHELHQDWFANKSATTASTINNQLCWTAGAELEEYVAQKFIKYFQEYPNSTYFMFGQEDNNTSFCKCERCKHAMEEEGYFNYAGLQIAFMNNVIKITRKWLDENQPGRNVKYVVYAYYATVNAPCKLNEETNAYEPSNDKVTPDKDLYILYAPITCNFGYPIDNSYFNSETNLQIKQWSDVAKKNLIMYLYDTNFHYYFSNFGNFNTVESMYRECYNKGVVYMYTQGAADCNTAPFVNLRNYVESKLMWNINDSYERLAKDFIDHYYLDASEEIYEFFNVTRERLTQYNTDQQDGGAIYTNIVNKTLYPYSVLRYFTSLFDRAMEKIGKYEDSSPSFYQNLKARIMREYLSVIYMKISLYRSELSDEEKKEMKEIFSYYINYFEITRVSEGADMIDVDSLFGI